MAIKSSLLLLCVLATSAVHADPSSDSCSAEGLTSKLREEHKELWDKVVNHRFTDELASGSIDKAVLSRYLVQDHRFLDAFIVLLSSMVSKARSLKDRLPGGRFLGLISGQENTYFERSFEALGVPDDDRLGSPDTPPTAGFKALMLDAAKGDLHEVLAVLVVAEWTYLSWGERVLPKSVEEPFWCREWVDLHSGEYFTSVVAYLRNLLDAEEAMLDEAGKAAVKKRFAQALKLELEFFDQAYVA